MTTPRHAALTKRLTLFDVYVISTGAMISSGLFLLPGVAASHTGPSVVLAYFVSGVLILPALLSKAELATAMPRAGGTYYYLDRTLGPLVGTIGGIGVWLTLILKSAFALIGMGAYLALVWEVPIVPTALGFTGVLTVVNLIGVKESTGMVRLLVLALLAVLVVFILHGLVRTAELWPGAAGARTWSPFLGEGTDGFIGTVGLVFVSYVGLTKVTSLAEEIRDPERTIPLGMLLALGTALSVYVACVLIMVVTLGPARLAGSLAPVAEAAAAFATWIPPAAAEGIVVVAAVAAFTAMANSGILAASRYPLAMARDRLFPDRFATMSRRGAPLQAVLLTAGLVALSLVALDVEGVAKLAGALQLLIFALINVAVIVMRESRIESYDPGFRAPLYPWMQLVGIFVPLMLVAEMGWLPVLFTIGVTVGAVGWYNSYARARIIREGAIFHVFERLGRRRFTGLDRELRVIMKEKGARSEDPFDHVVARADVVVREGPQRLEDLVADVSNRLAQRLPVTSVALVDGFGRGLRAGGTPVAHGAALLHTRLQGVEGTELGFARCASGVRVSEKEADADLVRQAAAEPIRAVFFLVSGSADPGRHLRMLAQIAGRVEDERFMPEWLGGRDEQALKETLLRDDRFLALEVCAGEKTAPLAGRALRELEMPEGALIALIRRGGESLVPRGHTVLREGDRLTILGEPAAIGELARRYRD